MVERTELELCVRKMVAYDILSKPLSSLGQKAGRRRDKLATETSTLVNGTEYERFTAVIETREEERARTLRQGISAFQEKHPRYGKLLEGMIKETRKEHNQHLVYHLNPGFTLGPQDYRSVMKDLGMNVREADAMYPHLLDISDRLGKAREHSQRSILL